MSLRAQKIRRLSGHEGAVYACRSEDKDHILTSGGDGWVVRWPVEGAEHGKLIAKVPAVVFSLDYHDLFDVILAGDIQGGLHWIYPGRTQQNRDIAHHFEGVFTVKAWKQYFFTGGGQGMLSCWEADDGSLVQSVRLSSTRIRSIYFHPHDSCCFVGTSDGSIIQLTTPELELIQRIDGAHDNTVFCCLVHPNGEVLYSGGRDARLRSWNIKDGILPMDNKPAHRFTVNDLCMEPEGRWLVSGSRDKTIKIWEPETLELLHVINANPEQAHINSVNTLLWNQNGKNRFVSGSDDRSLILWEIEGDEEE